MKPTKPENIDGRSRKMRMPETVNFRIDLASKQMLYALAISHGYSNLSEYCRDAAMQKIREAD